MPHITKNTTYAVHRGKVRNVSVGGCSFSRDQGELKHFIDIHSWSGLLRSRIYLYRMTRLACILLRTIFNHYFVVRGDRLGSYMKRTTFLADEIDQARKLLGLGELASIAEIKTAYRHLCKQWHPDALDDDATTSGKIKDINAAYRLLLDYCETYRFSFSPEEVESFDPERWWSRRFGDSLYPQSEEEDSGE